MLKRNLFVSVVFEEFLLSDFVFASTLSPADLFLASR